MKNVTFSDLLDNKRLADYLGLQDMDKSQFTAWLKDYRSNLFLDWKLSIPKVNVTISIRIPVNNVERPNCIRA